ncbi:MAG: cytochrome c biogenesis protein ResB [Pseudonocardiales bacterium]|nr:MAG: cytochrome c biogenesis protein ResB [Pseudonocardiales bacterium]
MTLLDRGSGDAGARLSTAPAPDAAARVRPGPLAALRRAWRQLTSMRTALLLLFLFAVAAVPGSVLPQRGLNQIKVDDYFAQHPQLAPVLDRLSLFDVFAAPWFAGIYLLLFVSLIGCLSSRVPLHVRALRRRPPATPRHLDRLPHSAAFSTADRAGTAADEVQAGLRRGRWRVERRFEDRGVVTLSAEKGYLRETGNLAFHVALVVLLFAVALGGLFGWKATVLVTEGDGFCDTVNSYDAFEPGRLVDGTRLPAFCAQLDDFTATYVAGTNEPSSFHARIRYAQGAAEPNRPYDLKVNSPLRLSGTRVYLLGHGFSPVMTVTDPSGQVFSAPTPFLPADASLASSGAVKLPDARPAQIGIDGVFTPQRDPADRLGLRSLSPRPVDPALSIRVYEGDLGLDSGAPQSVYSLDAGRIAAKRLKLADLADGRPARVVLGPGQSVRLADGTTVRFDGYREWARLQVGRDPGQLLALCAAAVMVCGLLLSLRVRRRRVWFRFTPGDTADPSEEPRRTLVAAGGLARSDAEVFGPEFDRVVAAVGDREDTGAG